MIRSDRIMRESQCLEALNTVLFCGVCGSRDGYIQSAGYWLYEFYKATKNETRVFAVHALLAEKLHAHDGWLIADAATAIFTEFYSLFPDEERAALDALMQSQAIDAEKVANKVFLGLAVIVLVILGGTELGTGAISEAIGYWLSSLQAQ
jgi:hypothetical protein